MTRPFVRGANGGPALVLDEVEREIVRDLLDQLLALLDSRRLESPEPSDDPLAAVIGLHGATEEPGDPALARLFPAAYRDDDEAAGDFRRYPEGGLRERKAAAVRAALGSMEDDAPAELDEATALHWLGALNDLRLVLGVRLDVREDDDPESWTDDPDAAAYAVYWWLGLAQESLLDLLP